jgi:hypothetical protein
VKIGAGGIGAFTGARSIISAAKAGVASDNSAAVRTSFFPMARPPFVRLSIEAAG